MIAGEIETEFISAFILTFLFVYDNNKTQGDYLRWLERWSHIPEVVGSNPISPTIQSSGGLMSGHSKWSSIKHKKGAADAKRGKIFTKLIREITTAARIGGGDSESNSRLRVAIAQAKAENMPKDNIEKAIKKGTSVGEGGENYEEHTYEGYGPGGVAILIQALTDNNKRTTADVRHILSRLNGNLAEPGSVSWIFNKKGYITFDKKTTDEDRIMEQVPVPA